MGCDILIRSTGKLIFHKKIQQSSINVIRFPLVAGGAIGVPIKSLLLVFEKSHNLVFSWVMMTTQQDCTQKQIRQENDERNREANKGKFLWSGGEENERQMANNVNCEEMRFVIRNLVYVEDPPQQRRKKFLLMSIEATSVFPQRGRDDAAQRR